MLQLKLERFTITVRYLTGSQFYLERLYILIEIVIF